ncbi:MAG: hypothetical protein A2Y22_09290 [Clostridiales bacterium GWD2_32_59]|nr:MAG: hypothetical protein A2Y22_09290 [Clostridiales bacterium GWD2_32_59]
MKRKIQKTSQNSVKTKINYKKLIIFLIAIFGIGWVVASQFDAKPAFVNLDEKSDIVNENTNDKGDTNDKGETGDNKEKSVSPLSGLPIDKDELKKRAVAVMINNHKKATPQSGISKADIIYEVPVEGEFVRLMAIFQDLNVDKIGPIRSARHYFMDYAFDNDAIYVHFGHSDQATEAIADLDVPSIDGINPKYEAIMTWRDKERQKSSGLEHSAYTSGKKIKAAWKLAKYEVENDEDYKPMFKFSDEILNTDDWGLCTKITIPYSYYQKSVFEYNESSDTYKRFQFAAPHIDADTGKQLEFTNVIIQYSKVSPIKNDSYGRKNIDTVSDGEALYLTNGKIIPIKWSKSNHKAEVEYTYEDGKSLVLNKGKTWISIVPNEIKIIKE